MGAPTPDRFTADAASDKPRWAAAIFSSRESVDTLVRCIEATRRALLPAGNGAVIDVLVNGQRSLAGAVAKLLLEQAPATRSCTLRLWFLRLGDKAHAWNEYTHRIATEPLPDCCFCLDGYVAPQADALTLLAAALAATAQALAATGVPSGSRSAAALRNQLLREGGLHGNLFALRGSTLAELRRRGFRLPLGLYRTDSVLGAALAFRLDPARQRWDRHAVLVHPDASWRVPPSRWWSWPSLLGQFERRVRQARGELEICAVRQHLAVEKRSPESLVSPASALVEGWISEHPDAARRLLWRRPLARHALRQLRRGRDWSAAAALPELLLELPADARFGYPESL